MSNEIIKNMSDKDYRDYDAVSRSELMDVLESIDKWKERKGVDTRATRFGTYFHSRVLEPDTVEQNYNLVDVASYSTKKAKEVKELEPNKSVVIKPDWAKADSMVSKLSLNSEAKRLLWDIEGDNEVTFIKQSEKYGLKLKCRVDRVLWDEGILIDLKTTRDDARPHAFMKSVMAYKYELQAAYYKDLVKQCTGRDWDFLFLVVEKESPHGIKTHTISEDDEQLGRLQYQLALRRLSDYKRGLIKETGYSKDLNTVNLPTYYRDSIQTLLHSF